LRILYEGGATARSRERKQSNNPSLIPNSGDERNKKGKEGGKEIEIPEGKKAGATLAASPILAVAKRKEEKGRKKVLREPATIRATVGKGKRY